MIFFDGDSKMKRILGYLLLFVGAYGALIELIGMLLVPHANVIANNLVGFVIGIIIASLGWKWIQSAKTVESTSERVGENVANVFRKYAAPSGPKIGNVDQYLENIDKREDLDLDKVLK